MFEDWMKNSSLHPYFLLLKLRSNIKHERKFFTTISSTSKFVKKTPLRVVFSTLFSVFNIVMKHLFARITKLEKKSKACMYAYKYSCATSNKYIQRWDDLWGTELTQFSIPSLNIPIVSWFPVGDTVHWTCSYPALHCLWSSVSGL